jgi:endonuclease III
LRGVWHISLEVSSKAKSVAENLDINLHEFEGEMLSRVESALVKLSIKYCRRNRCEECPVKDFCRVGFEIV